jgi:hypothetical protein
MWNGRPAVPIPTCKRDYTPGRVREGEGVAAQLLQAGADLNRAAGPVLITPAGR